MNGEVSYEKVVEREFKGVPTMLCLDQLYRHAQGRQRGTCH